MMKKILCAIVLAAGLMSAQYAQAQQNKKGELRYSGGAEAALPLGDLGKFTSFGAGAFAMLDYGLTDKLHLQGSAAYMYFLAKGGIAGTFGIIPIKAGAAYYVTEQVSVMAGSGFVSFSGGSGLHYYGGVGYDLERLGFSLQYNGVSNQGFSSSWAGLRVAYSFGD